ncbi:hypothetical protein SAMN04488074_13421 [Lentzea albidocapillata subsp. violacea]|uniref:DUF6545 domain-containing protein n=1 Tax=Lentzea albidocapillata subsp. violacea TaxID=128104 RepID=A0A1G9YMF5_9PSEU|nr:MAB_1171c family putative transporter [Lentzea albidocapillata]SDN09725.1 hypothetical protein SAMN04488074_13421 [Lentzea albidocapillata subsp. violacea]
MVDAFFLVAALGIAALGLYKYQALRHAPADRKPAIRPVCVSCLFAVPAVLLAAPAIGVNLDRVTGVHSLSILLGFCFALGFVCSVQTMLVYWLHPPAAAWRTSRWLVLTYTSVAAAIIVLFFLGDRPAERHLDFAAAYAGEPYLAELLVLYFLSYAVGVANVVRLCWQWSHHPETTDRPWLRRGLRLTAVGILFPVAYGVISLAAVIGSWFGAELDSWSSEIAPALSVLGVPLVIVGNSIAAWGPGLSSVWGRVTHLGADLRDYRALADLWRALRSVEPEMVHTPGSLADRFSLRRRLFWRVIEINDWLHQLSSQRDANLTAAARRKARQADLDDVQTAALEEAVHLKTALLARTAGGSSTNRPNQTHADDTDDAGHAFAGERRRLVLIARAFTSPLSDEAVLAASQTTRSMRAQPHP